jgi:diguanylate cyclase (GGDEF)-like protein
MTQPHNVPPPRIGLRKKTESSLKSRLRRLRQYVDPGQWSLKSRFLYITAALLVLGNVVLIIFFYHTQHIHVRQLGRDHLSLLGNWLDSAIERQQAILSAQAAALASIPEIQDSVATADAPRLKRVALPYLDRLRAASNSGAYHFEFSLADGTPFLVTDSSEVLTHAQTPAPEPEGFTSLGVSAGRNGMAIRATAVIISAQRVAGHLTVSVDLGAVIRTLHLPREDAVLLLLRDTTKPGWNVVQHFGDAVLNPAKAIQTAEEGVMQHGSVHASFIALADDQGQVLGGLVLGHDTGLQIQILWSRLAQFMLVFGAGATLVWVFLFLNVKRVETFFTRLKKILISSHSNYFSERFETEHVYCLDILHCHNDECPVHQDPSLVCYLETGSEAISPRWRDTCIYLNTYEKCCKCPVYATRRGDEMTEISNVVNTMMRFNGNFLNRVGHLLAYVLGYQERTGKVPSLDDISDQLEQMAQLTVFGHDLHGVVAKKEVYEQLTHIFGQRFGLNRVVLFEMDHDNGRLPVVLDSVPGAPLCKDEILTNPKTCRCKRMAEEVISFDNPKLCLHFNADLNRDVRCCLPIVMSGQVGAVLSFLAPKPGWETMRHLVPIMRKYLEVAAPVLNSLRLLDITREQSLRDPLTQCNNRRFLDEFIARYEALANRDKQCTGFLMVDLDFFKQVNDKYGHQAGDAVLQQVGRILQASMRNSDLLIRYGGEEFLILLMNIQPGFLVPIAEKIREAVERHEFSLPDGVLIKKTVSIGTSEHPTDADVFYKAIKFADVALYEAKRRGRNQVVSFIPELWDKDEY